MPAETVGEIIKRIPVIEASDSVRRAAGMLRESGGSLLFVHSQDHITGTLSEAAISELLGRNSDVEAALDSQIEPLVEPMPPFVNSRISLAEAAHVFASTGQDVLPVINDFGSFYGAVYRSDVVGALAKTLRPPTVGGMATPLGVYLTTGSASAAAGNLGLFLSGVAIAVMIGLAHVLALGVMKGIAALSGFPLSAYLDSPPLVLPPNLLDLPFYVLAVLTIVLFMALMRLSPLAGYHAAEHMTVHAIEVGEPLTPDYVRRMQRVHPRCGTNLLAAAGIFLIIVSQFGGEVAVLFGLLIVILGWRAAGAWLQYFVTTRDPSDRQLESGIAAGRQLLERYQERPGYQAVGFERVWRLGFVQTLVGLLTTTWLLQKLAEHLPV